MNHRPILATILTQNLRHNLSIVKKRTNNIPTWAVIKANAYGHTTQAALQGFANSEGIALLELEQVQVARKLGWLKKVLLLEGAFSARDYPEFQHLACDFVIHQQEQIEWLADYSQTLDISSLRSFQSHSQIWLKLNSGMNRLGFKSLAYLEAYQTLKAFGFQVNHLTHFANADEESMTPSVDQQWDLFQKTTQELEGYRSAANSAAILFHPRTHSDYTRPGIMLYGASPSGSFEDIAQEGLRATMCLSSQVIAIQNLDIGEQVGYGGQFTASRPTTIAVLACGYADGYPRHAPNGTPVWVGGASGCIAPLAGRVSMDMLTVDVTDIKNVRVGTPVELWGENLPIDHVAKASKTVGYELMCAVAPRVPVLMI
jgi:alanine racemase